MTSIHLRRLEALKAHTADRLIAHAHAEGLSVEQLRDALVPWYTIRNDAGDAVEILIYDEVGGSFGVDPEQFARDLSDIDAPIIKVRLNSPGGSVFDSIAIYNSLNHHTARKIVYVDSLAASGASIIAMAGDEVVMMPGSQMMIHDASAHENGQAADMAKMSTFLDRQSANVAEIYQLRGGGTADEWRELMLAETWMFAAEAVDMGLADRVEEVKPEPADPQTREMLGRSFDLGQFRYAGRRAAPSPHRRAAGVPQQRGAIASHSTATVDTPWDGPAAVAAAPNEAATLRHMHAWVDSSGDPDAKASYKFPHHAAGTDTAANLSGVRNGLARLSSASIPDGDRPGVERHLRRHLTDGGGGESAATTPREERIAAAGRRRDAARQQARGTRSHGRQIRFEHIPCGRARSLPFPTQLRSTTISRDGKDYHQLEGVASVVDRGYEMWDEFGPYEEVIASGSFDKTLAENPDVAFLVNHKGLSMARTTNDTLDLWADPHLSMRALLNPQRNDVRDLLVAIDDQTVDEMSFAFMLELGDWSDDFLTFRISQVNLHRGDVSAVNYGANPFTSIAGRSLEPQEISARTSAAGRQRDLLAELEHLPAPALRALAARLSARVDVRLAEITAEIDTPPATGRSISHIKALLLEN